MVANIDIKSCHYCGLAQYIPNKPPFYKVVCVRCGAAFPSCQSYHHLLCRIFSVSALFLYIPAVTLPLMRFERLGYTSQNNLITGILNLIDEGNWLVGIIVFLFSLVLPPVKLLALFILTTFNQYWKHQHRVRLYRIVEYVGRWGMLDVMLMAILIVFVKLGHWVQIEGGSGLTAFTAMVMLSLLASFFFHPVCLWDDDDVTTYRDT